MVSARPPPSPARGRIAYPTIPNYTAGDSENAPIYNGSEPVTKVTSSDSDKSASRAWWRGRRDRSSSEPQRMDHRSVFGVSLQQSIEYASVQISTSGSDGSLYVWGLIPIVVAKCGRYLKETATDVEGTFRISGSAKRMRELQTLFDTGPKFGKNVDWATLPYTTHDVATIFRRFLTQMPESVIPSEFYADFRNVDRDDIESAIKSYKELIRGMPAANQHLLLYILDLLNVFARKADQNLMNAANLALIFQTGVLSHPQHMMRPREHVLSQQVLEFLIDNQDSFLIGMELKSKKKKRKNTRRTDVAEPAITAPVPPPSPPQYPKADLEYMVASDSDDEAPDGGYYIIEAQPISASSQTQPQSEDAKSKPAPEVLASLIPPPRQPRPPRPTIQDSMDMSDSDDEPPTGGYQVRIGTFLTRRASHSATIPSSIDGRKTGPSRRPIQLPGRAIKPKEAS